MPDDIYKPSGPLVKTGQARNANPNYSHGDFVNPTIHPTTGATETLAINSSGDEVGTPEDPVSVSVVDEVSIAGDVDASIADGADVAFGSVADAAVQDAAGTGNAHLRGIIKTLLAGINVSGPLTSAQLTAAALATAAQIGEVQASPSANTVLDRLKAIATALASVAVTGPLTDTQLRASAVPVSGPLTDTQLRNSAVPVSLASLPALAAGSAIAGALYQISGALVDAAGNVLTVKHSSPANVAASQTDSSIVSAVASRKLRVLSVYAVAGATATTLTFNTKPAGAGTAISALLANGANGGEILPHNPHGWFETASGEGLTVTTGAGATTGLQVNYVEVP